MDLDVQRKIKQGDEIYKAAIDGKIDADIDGYVKNKMGFVAANGWMLKPAGKYVWISSLAFGFLLLCCSLDFWAVVIAWVYWFFGVMVLYTRYTARGHAEKFEAFVASNHPRLHQANDDRASPRPSNGAVDLSAELAKLEQLRKSGAIDEDEFRAAKAAVIKRAS